MIPLGSIYALAAAGIVVMGALGYGKYQSVRADRSEAELVSYKAQAEAEAEKLRAKAAEVRVEVVTKYRDRIQEVRVPETVEVVREIEVIRQSDCKLPAAWVRLHDAATGSGTPAPAGADDGSEISCASAIEGVRENYKRFHENAAQLEALQKWAASVSSP